MRSYLVKKNPIGSAVSEILWYKHTNTQTDKQTSCYFSIRINSLFNVTSLPELIPSAKLDVRYHQEMATVFHVTSVRCFISHVRDVIAFALFKIKIKDAGLHKTRYVIHFYY